jgi:hypothetical protein
VGRELVAVGRRAAGGSAAAIIATVGAALGCFRRDAVAFGIKDDEPARAFARAGGLEAGVAEKEMEHPSLAGVHGLEPEGLAGVVDLVDGSVSGIVESVRAGSLIAIHVEGDAIVVVGL